MIKSDTEFAHAMTTISIQKWYVIPYLESQLEQGEYSYQFNYELIKHLRYGFLAQASSRTIVKYMSYHIIPNFSIEKAHITIRYISKLHQHVCVYTYSA